MSDAQEVNIGVPWRQLEVGEAFRTSSRTITEADVVQFVAYAGFSEPLFLDARHGRPDGSPGRVVPALLTLAYADGLVLQSRLLHGTGIAMLDIETKVLAPVAIGDTINVTVQVDEVRPTSDGVRAVVRTTNSVVNQHDDVVMTYRPTRLLR